MEHCESHEHGRLSGNESGFAGVFARFRVLFSPAECEPLTAEVAFVAPRAAGGARATDSARCAFQPVTSPAKRALARPTETVPSAKWAGPRRTAPAWVRARPAGWPLSLPLPTPSPHCTTASVVTVSRQSCVALGQSGHTPHLQGEESACPPLLARTQGFSEAMWKQGAPSNSSVVAPRVPRPHPCMQEASKPGHQSPSSTLCSLLSRAGPDRGTDWAASCVVRKAVGAAAHSCALCSRCGRVCGRDAPLRPTAALRERRRLLQLRRCAPRRLPLSHTVLSQALLAL